jgi:hypothetical protein
VHRWYFEVILLKINLSPKYYQYYVADPTRGKEAEANAGPSQDRRRAAAAAASAKGQRPPHAARMPSGSRRKPQVKDGDEEAHLNPRHGEKETAAARRGKSAKGLQLPTTHEDHSQAGRKRTESAALGQSHFISPAHTNLGTCPVVRL